MPSCHGLIGLRTEIAAPPGHDHRRPARADQGAATNPLWSNLATHRRPPPALRPDPAPAEPAMTTGRSPASSPTAIARRGVEGAGEGLPGREPLERSFGAGLESVRVHTGPAAQEACGRLGAAAYALDNRIALGTPGPPSPWLLAHEVAHTLQQRDPARDPGGHAAHPEADATQAATAAAAGRPAAVRASAPPGVPQCFRFSAASQKDYPKALAFLRDEMPKVSNDARLLKAVVDGARSSESTVRAGLPWDAGPWVIPKTLRGTQAGRFSTRRGSQELEVHKGELDKWEAEKDPGLNEAYEFWLETVVLHEYVHYLGDNREKDDEEWGKDFEEKAYGNFIATRDAAWNLERFLRARFGDGEYEVAVTAKEAAFPQRFRVVGADAGNGTYTGVVGTSVKVTKNFDLKGRWQILVEHDDGQNGWQPSRIRLVYVSIGSEWLIRTEDWTDRDNNDLEISVKKTASAKPPSGGTP